MNPLVSIVMATYNEKPEIISEAIASVIKQTYEKFELIIVDDSTREDTVKTIKAFLTDNRVKYLHGEKKIGFVASLNKGLQLAKGQYIARMDADDICFPDRLEKQVNFFENNPEYYLIGGQIEIIDNQGLVVSKRHYPTSRFGMYLFSTIRSPFAHSTVIFRRELVDRGFYYNDSLPASEDLDLWLRVMYSGYKVTNIPDNVLQFRISEDFAEKRSADKEVTYTAQVRKNNFSKKHLIHSTLSYLSSRIYYNMPSKWLATMHNIQNNQK